MTDIIGIICPSVLCCYTCFLFYSCNKIKKNKKQDIKNKKQELISLKKELQNIDIKYEKYLIKTEILFDTDKITIEDKMHLEQQRKKLYNIETYSIRLKIAIIEYELLDDNEKNQRMQQKIINENNKEKERERKIIIEQDKEKKEYLVQIDIIE